VDGSRDLGLFPLDLVLLPGERIPLHLFEPRYRQLFADCVLEARPFVLVRAEGGGGTAAIGCTAVFERLVQRLEDGRLTVVVAGGEPVEIVEETEGHLYFSALCRPVADNPVVVDAAAAEEVATRFRELSRRLTGEDRDPPAQPGVPLSYAVAGAVELPADLTQGLLETRDENERLRTVAEALAAALRSADRAEVAAERASRNGKVSH
jgi:ATP-dependent Lon protease